MSSSTIVRATLLAALLIVWGAAGASSVWAQETPAPLSVTGPPTPAPADSGPAVSEDAPVALPPAFLEMIQDIPATSCLHDPQPCGSDRVVVQTGVRQPDGSLAFGPGVAGAPAASASTQAAAAIPQCALKADPPQIFYTIASDNYAARGTGSNNCTGAVTHMETYVTLMDLISSGWRNLAVVSDSRTNGSVTLTARYDCGPHTSLRTYNTRVEGYATVEGITYAASDNAWGDHSCPK